MVKRVIKIIWGYNHRAQIVDDPNYDILMDGDKRIKVIRYNHKQPVKLDKVDYFAIIFEIEDIFKIKWVARKDFMKWFIAEDWKNKPYLKDFLKVDN